LAFYAETSNSTTYSKKIYQKFKKELKLLLNQPDIGFKTEFDSVHGLIVDHYIILCENVEGNIVVHSVWDCRQNPDDLQIK